MNENANGKPVLQVLREMKVGESVTYSISRASYVSSACVRFGLEWGKTFRTAVNRADRTVSITRTA